MARPTSQPAARQNNVDHGPASGPARAAAPPIGGRIEPIPSHIETRGGRTWRVCSDGYATNLDAPQWTIPAPPAEPQPDRAALAEAAGLTKTAERIRRRSARPSSPKVAPFKHTGGAA